MALWSRRRGPNLDVVRDAYGDAYVDELISHSMPNAQRREVSAQGCERLYAMGIGYATHIQRSTTNEHVRKSIERKTSLRHYSGELRNCRQISPHCALETRLRYKEIQRAVR